MSTSEELLDRQNRDGGWSYRRGGGSWTEPTCYALMALLASGQVSAPEVQRGLQWLASKQRSDGGWAPRTEVQESTWVTALALLVPQTVSASFDRARASAWFVEQTGKESSFIPRLPVRLLGV